MTENIESVSHPKRANYIDELLDSANNRWECDEQTAGRIEFWLKEIFNTVNLQAQSLGHFCEYGVGDIYMADSYYAVKWETNMHKRHWKNRDGDCYYGTEIDDKKPFSWYENSAAQKMLMALINMLLL
ncbi:1049_t:CDS:2 [Ambispora gerdemannii]|uniref:1049_t:CDS:1 n=1 Tax=Ambispora gerdemannii TaxID=144530 RepID=A0A9N8ZYA3_9GLOM|nr:1049_t:CDS:2 [Ambispora gerdemannii]